MAEEYKRKWRTGKCLERIPPMKSVFSTYHGWRMRGRLRIWQRAGGKAGGRKKGEAPGGGGPGGQEKNY